MDRLEKINISQENNPKEKDFQAPKNAFIHLLTAPDTVFTTRDKMVTQDKHSSLVLTSEKIPDKIKQTTNIRCDQCSSGRSTDSYGLIPERHVTSSGI